MCKYLEDFKKIFGEKEIKSKYKISKLGGLKESSFSKDYNSLIELFQDGFYDRFVLVPNIKSYLNAFYNCDTLQEYLENKYGKEILPQLEKECGKINSNSIYILLDTDIDCSLRYEKLDGNVFETIHKLLLLNSNYTKYSTTTYTIFKL